MPGFLHNTYAVLRRELVRLTHQPMYFVLMLVLPVVSFAFFALLFNKGVATFSPSGPVHVAIPVLPPRRPWSPTKSRTWTKASG